MPADRSRRTDGLREGYVGVVAQQGRVTLDRDFNAEHGYLAGRLEALTLDLVGPCGTPDDGFKISLPGAGAPPLWTPPAPLSAPNPDPPFDLLVSPGAMYLGGRRALLPAVPAAAAVTYSYFDQPDVAHPDPVSGGENGPAQEVAYLDLVEQEVSAVEDPDLLEVALGGPDTTQRLRLLRRVRRLPVQATDCTTGWDDAQEQWLSDAGLALDPATMALRSQTWLQVSFADEGATTDPCDPVVVNGYLGAENQTIRVQIAANGAGGVDATQAGLIWGYDNASFLYRATPVAANPAMLTIAPTPPDSFHIPQKNQVVEILRTAAVIASEPDMTDPTGQATIVRCVAEATGFLARLTQPYGPSGAGDPTSYIVLDQPLPPEFLADETPLFLRVWQSQISFDPGGGTVLLTDDVTGASTGVQVTLSTSQGAPLTPGAFWEIAVRPSTPQAVYPERLLTEPQPPDGPARWACPLAVVDWTQDPPTISDCRTPFGANQGGGCCCTISVTPTGKLGLQQAIDLAAKAHGGTVCLAGGKYLLTAPLVFGPAHNSVTLEACQPAIIGAAPGNEKAFSEGLIQIVNAPRVTLRGLDLAPPLSPRPATVNGQLHRLLAGGVFDARGLAAASDAIEVTVGVRLAESSGVTIEDCIVAFAASRDQQPPVIFGAGVLAQVDCPGLTIESCTFESFLPRTFHRQATTGETSPIGVGKPVLPPRFETGGLASAAAAAPAAPAAKPEAAVAPGEVFVDLARTSFLTIGAHTLATEAATTESQLVAIVGCLAVATLAADGKSVLTANLGQVSLRRNRFQNLTLGVFGVAAIQTLRLEDNDAVGCSGGYWFGLPGLRTPTDPKAQPLFQAFTAATAFTEFFVISAIGPSFPTPPNAVASAPGGVAALFASGNQVEPPTAAQGSTSALVLLGNRTPVEGADVSVSSIVANNRLRSRCVAQIPTAFISTGAVDRCAVTGNLILSELVPGANSGPSLWLVPDPISGAAPMLTAAGNVLQGRTTLQEINRAGDTPPESWANLNAQSF